MNQTLHTVCEQAVYLIELLFGLIKIDIMNERKIEIQWNILEEESRVIKSVVDLCHIPCKFVACHFKIDDEKYKTKRSRDAIIIKQYSELKLLGKYYPQVCLFFGKDQQQQIKIRQFISFYQADLKPSLRLPLKQYFSIAQQSFNKEIINKKVLQIQKTLHIIDQLLKKSGNTFMLGNNLTIVDLLLYFDTCNLVYFRKNHLKYQAVTLWFAKVYEVKEIKIITNQWFSMAKQISALFRFKRPRSTL